MTNLTNRKCPLTIITQIIKQGDICVHCFTPFIHIYISLWFVAAARNNKEPVQKDLPLTQTVMESLLKTEKEYT